MRLILIKVYLYQRSSERKADTESMNFNKETPPPQSDVHAAATRPGGMEAYFSGRGRLMSSAHGGFVLTPYSWFLCFHYVNARSSSEDVCPSAARSSVRNPPVSDVKSALKCALDDKAVS